MTPYTWMFISTHGNLREFIFKYQSISSLIQLEYSAFKDATVPICTFVIQNQTGSTMGEYIRLEEFKGEELQPIKVKEAVGNPDVNYRFTVDSKYFDDIPGSPIAYWASEQVRMIFKESEKLGDIAQPRQGLATADNDRFLRLWHEVQLSNIGFGYENATQALNSKEKWFPYNKGGSFRKWYGNQEYVINWGNNGSEIKAFDRAVVRNESFYFGEGITWSDVSSSYFGARYTPKGFLFDVKGSSLFFEENRIMFYLYAILTSKIAYRFLGFLNPTLSFQVGDLKRIPIKIKEDKSKVVTFVKDNISISKTDWDSFETSWDFQRHPFLTYQKETSTLYQTYTNWENHAESQFRQLQQNEEELNRIFIDLYGLQDELTPEVPDKEVTVRRADKVRDAKSFLSYFIGCLMGRYSLDVEGLAYAGGQWDDAKYQRFQPQPHGLVLFTDQAYFEDDIILRLKEFLQVIYGQETIQENLCWLADALSLKANETAEERLRRYFIDEFYKDHNKIYQKRPIYWLVDSGKQKGFRALFYLHRYSKETLPMMRFELLQELQSKYANEIKRLEDALVNPRLSAKEKKQLEKDRAGLQKRQEELIMFDKHLADVANQQMELDLDDGVNHNYEKFGKLFATRK